MAKNFNVPRTDTLVIAVWYDSAEQRVCWYDDKVKHWILLGSFMAKQLVPAFEMRIEHPRRWATLYELKESVVRAYAERTKI